MQSRRECERLAAVDYTGMLNRQGFTLGQILARRMILP
jgi:hypothetical protein